MFFCPMIQTFLLVGWEAKSTNSSKVNLMLVLKLLNLVVYHKRTMISKMTSSWRSEWPTTAAPWRQPRTPLLWFTICSKKKELSCPTVLAFSLWVPFLTEWFTVTTTQFCKWGNSAPKDSTSSKATTRVTHVRRTARVVWDRDSAVSPVFPPFTPNPRNAYPVPMDAWSVPINTSASNVDRLTYGSPRYANALKWSIVIRLLSNGVIAHKTAYCASMSNNV